MHRFAGRADGRPLAHRQQRPPDPRPPRRHRVLASSLIPGDEILVSTSSTASPVSGQGRPEGRRDRARERHAAAGELLYCYNIVNPTNVIPVHGEPRHLNANAELALAHRRTRRAITDRPDGGVVDLVDGKALVPSVPCPCGYVYVDGASVGDLTESSLKDRRVLGTEGFITCFVVVDSVDGKVTAGPEIQARGFVEDDAVFDDVIPKIKQSRRGRPAQRHDRPVRAPAAGASRARTLGQRPAPQAPDDRPRRRRGLTLRADRPQTVDV